MGCFFSKKEAASWGKAASTVRRRRSPPPTELEAPQEETVKEVLSETAKPRARPRAEVKEEEEVVGIKKCSKAGPGLNSMNSGYNERFEENFEVRSMSEGFSISMTVMEKREGEEGDAKEVEGKVRRMREEKSSAKLQRKRSVFGELSRNKERSTGVGVGFDCSSGRSSPSPVKRREGTVRRTYSAKEAGQERAARSRVPSENKICPKK